MTCHLAILHEPYLSRILSGEKTIESRWLKRRVAPYARVAAGDTIYLKQASGPIVAMAQAAEIWQFDDLTPARVDELLARFGDRLRLEPDFADHARGQRYAVLIKLADVQLLPQPLSFRQRGRSGWVILDYRLQIAD
jgi:hypothetical protein